MANGGDILEITYNHDTVGAGTLYCKSNEDGTLDIGGFRSNDDDNASTGDGEFIDQMNWRRGSFECPPIAWNMTDAEEKSKLEAVAESSVLADWTISHIMGRIWGGKGKPVGDIPGSTNTGLITLKIAFSGKVRPLT